MFCTNCGRRLGADDKFCARCGMAVSADQEDVETLRSPAADGESPETPNYVPPVIRTATSTAEMHKPLVSVPSPIVVTPNEATADKREAVTRPSEPVAEMREPGLGAAEPVDYVDEPSAQASVPDRRSNELFTYSYPPDAPKPSSFSLVLILATALIAGALLALLWMMYAKPGKIKDANVDVTLTPTSAEVVAGNALDFAASVSGSSNPEVTWTVEEGASGGRVVTRGAQADGSQVSLLVVYVAPDTAGTYHLVATSKSNPQKSATAEITVTPR